MRSCSMMERRSGRSPTIRPKRRPPLSATPIIGTLPKALAALLPALPDVAERDAPTARRQPAVPAATDPIPPAYCAEPAVGADAAGCDRGRGGAVAPSRHSAIPAAAGADSFYTMASGGLGYSLPASIGVALARPGRRVVGLIGDGSAMYCVQAIWTAAQRQLPITFVIMNNSGYGAMRAFSQLMQAHRPPGIDLPRDRLRCARQGRSVAPGRRVTDVDDLDRLVLSRHWRRAAPRWSISPSTTPRRICSAIRTSHAFPLPAAAAQQRATVDADAVSSWGLRRGWRSWWISIWSCRTCRTACHRCRRRGRR